MKADLLAELGFVNRNVDEMIRLLERATDAGIWTRQEATRHEARLESLRAKLNADFAELVCAKERFEQHRFSGQRLVEELNNPFADRHSKQTKQTNQTKH